MVSLRNVSMEKHRNECLNGVVWQRVTKEVFVGKDVLEFGLFDAVSHFKMGTQTVLQLYDALQIPAGKYTEDGCQFLDAERTYKAVHKDQEHNKKQRKVLKG